MQANNFNTALNYKTELQKSFNDSYYRGKEWLGWWNRNAKYVEKNTKHMVATEVMTYIYVMLAGQNEISSLKN